MWRVENCPPEHTRCLSSKFSASGNRIICFLVFFFFFLPVWIFEIGWLGRKLGFTFYSYGLNWSRASLVSVLKLTRMLIPQQVLVQADQASNFSQLFIFHMYLVVSRIVWTGLTECISFHGSLSAHTHTHDKGVRWCVSSCEVMASMLERQHYSPGWQRSRRPASSATFSASAEVRD